MQRGGSPVRLPDAECRHGRSSSSALWRTTPAGVNGPPRAVIRGANTDCQGKSYYSTLAFDAAGMLSRDRQAAPAAGSRRASLGLVDPTPLQCRSDNAKACLSGAQVMALQRMFGGARDGTGRTPHADWPWDPGIASFGWRIWKIGVPNPARANHAVNVTLGACALPYVFMTPVDTPAAGELRTYMFAFDFNASATRILNSRRSCAGWRRGSHPTQSSQRPSPRVRGPAAPVRYARIQHRPSTSAAATSTTRHFMCR